MSKNIVIIGGGITGLSAAWELQKHAGDSLHITLLERENQWGGKISTKKLITPEGDSISIDGGPESFVTRKPEVWDLAHELGIQNKLTDPGSETSHMYVLDGGVPTPVPLSPAAFIRSPLMTTKGKLRMLAEPFIPAKRDNADESLAEFASRRLGVEAMEKFIGPILAGIYNTDPHRQSILTTSPIMREMEAEYGGLFKGALGRMRAARKQKNESKPPRFIAFEQGAQDLIDALSVQMEANGADLRLNVETVKVEPHANGYAVTLGDSEVLYADALILATPANASAQILDGVGTEVSSMLEKIRHENIGTISLVYRAEDVQMAKRIHGLMVPRREGRAIDAVTFTSLKMPTRAPQELLLLRVFFGGGKPELVEFEDDALLSKVSEELADLLGIAAEPIEMVPFRWPCSFPQADVGHLDLVDEIENLLPKGVYVAGSSYRGIGVPDCIRQGQQAADDVVNYLAL
ncbi:MAG: protoporphyrinogen oxidase [Anaerolineales bacterium]|nr:protoporphyrinogen oxidase [Chloroflexota bacterium]MBL6980572.1 protoporphyrinogen oxidase [Anaerolineales bacterium]